MHSRIAAGLLRLVLACLLSLGLAVASARAQTPLRHTLTLKLSSARAAAQPVEATLLLGYEMQCGYPGPGPVVLTFPAASRLPSRSSTASVLVDGKAAPSVRVSGRTVSVGLPAAPQIMCDVIGPGRLTIELTRNFGLGSPARAGSYVVHAARGATNFSARFTILPK